ncbi:hypothetical protein pb186bvf_000452 [Paramecium bursaria]
MFSSKFFQIAQSQQLKHHQDPTSTSPYEIISDDQEEFEFQNLEANCRDEIVYFDSEESTSERDQAFPVKKDVFYIGKNVEFNDLQIKEDVQNIFCQDYVCQELNLQQNNHKDEYIEFKEQYSAVSNNSSMKEIKKKISKKKIIDVIPQYNIKSKLLPKATKNIYKNIVRALKSFSSIIIQNYSIIECLQSKQKCTLQEDFHRQDGKTGKEKLNQLLQHDLGRNLCKLFFRQNKFALELLKNNKTDLSTAFRMIPDFITLCD